MVGFSLEEKKGRYKILLYSENPQAINVLKRKFDRENIDLVVKNLQHKRIFATNTKSNGGDADKNYLMVVYDLTSKSVDYQRTLLQTKNLAQNLVFVLKSQANQRQNVRDYKNKTIFVDDLSRSTTEKVGDYLVRHVTDEQNGTVVFTNKNKRRPALKIKNVLFLLLSILVFTPYVLAALVSTNDLLFNRILLNKVDVGVANKITETYTKELGIVNSVVGFYKRTPLFGAFYTKAFELSSKYYLKNIYMQKMLNKLSISNCYTKEFFLNNSVENLCGVGRSLSTTANGGISNPFLKTENMLGEINNIQKTMQQTFTISSQNYVAVVVQEGGVLTPTGTSPQKIYIYEISEGKYKVIENFTQEYLKDKFKGDIVRVSKLNNYDIFEGSMDIKDKYKIYNRAINEMFDINISGIVFFEDKNEKDLRGIINTLLQKRLSVEDAVLLHQKSLELLKNGLVFYLSNGNTPVVNESVFWEYPSEGVCTGSSISFIETTENLDDFKSGAVDVRGEYFDGKLSLAIYYKNNSFNNNDSFIIKSSEGLSLVSGGADNLIQEKVYENKFEYLISKTKSGSINGLVARYLLLPSDCDKGFVFRVDKQFGNEKLVLNYDIRTERQLYLYIDHSLTRRGNKFYNDGLLYLNKDFLFEFVN